VRFAAIRVFVNSEDHPIPQERWLLIRKELDGSCIKFTLSNSPLDTSLKVPAESGWKERFKMRKGLQVGSVSCYGIERLAPPYCNSLAMLYLLFIKTSLGEHAEKVTLKDALWIVEG
jgi:hypothetical protein